jgi:hypothetical protein
MSKKVYVTVKVRLIIACNDDADVNGILENMDYDFSTEDADIEDMEIKKWKITDSK